MVRAARLTVGIQFSSPDSCEASSISNNSDTLGSYVAGSPVSFHILCALTRRRPRACNCALI